MSSAFSYRKCVLHPLSATWLLLAIATAFALAGLLPFINVFLLAGLALCLMQGQRYPWPSFNGSVLWLGALVCAYLAAVYRPKGFSYPVLWQPGILHAGGAPFQLYGNVGKCLTGLLLLVWLLPAYRALRPAALGWPSALLGVMAAVGVLWGFAWAVMGVPHIPKWPEGVLIFFAVNLFMTVIPEEAFFRLLLHWQIARTVRRVWLGQTLAIVSVSAVFALVHAPITHAYFALFLVAGLLYSLIFALTGRYSMAVVCHFVVNAVHILLLPYPLS